MSVASLATTPLAVRRRTLSPSGGPAVVSAVASILGRVQPLSGSEQRIYARDTERVTHRVYVAGRPDVRSDDELVLPGGRRLLVRAVRDIDELGRFVTIEAEEQS